jgi:hypothetical protein
MQKFLLFVLLVCAVPNTLLAQDSNQLMQELRTALAEKPSGLHCHLVPWRAAR